jgi:hypothetical protein
MDPVRSVLRCHLLAVPCVRRSTHVREASRKKLGHWSCLLFVHVRSLLEVEAKRSADKTTHMVLRRGHSPTSDSRFATGTRSTPDSARHLSLWRVCSICKQFVWTRFAQLTLGSSAGTPVFGQVSSPSTPSSVVRSYASSRSSPSGSGSRGRRVSPSPPSSPSVRYGRASPSPVTLGKMEVASFGSGSNSPQSQRYSRYQAQSSSSGSRDLSQPEASLV